MLNGMRMGEAELAVFPQLEYLPGGHVVVGPGNEPVGHRDRPTGSNDTRLAVR